MFFNPIKAQMTIKECTPLGHIVPVMMIFPAWNRSRENRDREEKKVERRPVVELSHDLLTLPRGNGSGGFCWSQPASSQAQAGAQWRLSSRIVGRISEEIWIESKSPTGDDGDQHGRCWRF